jgi:hypothetical protein
MKGWSQFVPKKAARGPENSVQKLKNYQHSRGKSTIKPMRAVYSGLTQSR